MYWCVAQLQPQKDQLALHCLALRGFACYAPRLRDRQTIRGCKVTKTPLLFPNYCFVRVDLQWSPAKFAPGVVNLILDGVAPAVIPNSVITDLKARERGGLIELPPPPPRFRRGDYVLIRRGVFSNKVGLYVGQRPADRIAILLSLLGTSRQVELPEQAAELWPGPDRGHGPGDAQRRR